MSGLLRRFIAAAAAALVIVLLCAAAGAQETDAIAPAVPASSEVKALAPAGSGEVKAPPPAESGAIKPPAAAVTPVSVPGSSGKPGAVKEGQKPVGWLGCTRACPICLRSCELNPGHYGNHMCSEGHQF